MSNELTDFKEWCLYIHTNKLNNKKYVGITSMLPERRWANGNGYRHNQHFYSAIQKYGWDNFDHTVYETGLSHISACRLEQKMIAELNTANPDFGYNNSLGGDGCVGGLVSDLTKARMAASRTGHEVAQSTREKIAEKLKNNQNAAGAVRSANTRRKMSESKFKAVGMYDDTGKLVRAFRSALEAGAELGINRKNISSCCLNKRKHAGGYAWRFV